VAHEIKRRNGYGNTLWSNQLFLLSPQQGGRVGNRDLWCSGVRDIHRWAQIRFIVSLFLFQNDRYRNNNVTITF
jgi:hypothetical protein